MLLNYNIKIQDQDFNQTHYNIPPLLSEKFSVACCTES